MTVCGGITTWGGNPSVCVYDVDEETLLPVARFTYAFDMDSANADGFISWGLYTDWLKDHEMQDLSPASYLKLAERLKQDSTFARKYQQRQGRNYDLSGNCDDWCRNNLYCQATTADSYEYATCMNSPSPYDLKNDFLNSVFQIIASPWVRKVEKKVLKKKIGFF